MPNVTIRRSDLSDEGLEELATLLREAGFTVKKAKPSLRGGAVTWWEVFVVTVEAVGSALVVGDIVRRFTARRRRRGHRRPQSVQIKDRKGNLLKEHKRSAAPVQKPAKRSQKRKPKGRQQRRR